MVDANKKNNDRFFKSKPYLKDPHEAIDFSPLSDKFSSFSILKKSIKKLPIAEARIKKPSKVLPTDHVINKKRAFHSGAKAATGAPTFHKAIPNIKEALGILPSSKKGKLVKMIDMTRNEARNLHTNIIRLLEQFNRVMDDDELNTELKKEAAQMALYFLEDAYDRLDPILGNLIIYNGLLKGNAEVGITGYIVAGKDPLLKPHPYLVMKEQEKELELELLEEFCDDPSLLLSARLRLEDFGISTIDYYRWKIKNAAQIEIDLNTAKGAGGMTGAGIQGFIFSGINYGVAAATLNPIVFAAGTYYAASTLIKMGEIGTKTHLQNQLISQRFNRLIEADERQVAQEKTLNKMKSVATFERGHNQVDNLSITAFGVAAMFAVPVTTPKPPSEDLPSVSTNHLLL